MVESQLGLQRPADLVGVDGAQAVEMWLRWQRQRSRPDRDLLVRYCAADAVTLRGVTGALLHGLGCDCGLPTGPAVWDELNEALPPPCPCEEPPAVAVAESATMALSQPIVASPAGWSGNGTGSRPAAPPPAPASPVDTPGAAARRRLRELLRRRFAQE